MGEVGDIVIGMGSMGGATARAMRGEGVQRKWSRPQAGAARDTQLSINTHACDQINRLAETLFTVEEVAELAAGIHLLTRREGGVIGSTADLSNPQPGHGSALCFPSIWFAFSTIREQLCQTSSAGV